MIGWQHTAALWALPLAAVPIVIHLLRTHRAKRVAFPSLRFVEPSRTAAVRMRLPSDVVLMLLRMAIVALAVAALAGPIVLTSGRTTAWNARTARVVVVDSSESMRRPDGSGVAPDKAAAEAADAELRTATYGRRIDAPNLDEGLVRASAWLAASPPARREVVVISDMQRGALRGNTAAAVAEGTGLRFVVVGRPADKARFDGARLFGAANVGARDQVIAVTKDTTAAAIVTRETPEMAGLRLVAPPGAEAGVSRLLRAVAVAGAPAGSAQQPIAMTFAGSPADTSAQPAALRSGWMLRTALRMQKDPTLAAPTSAGLAAPARRNNTPGEPWMVVARDRDGAPLVRAAASGSELLLAIAASPDSLVAAEVVRAALVARLDVRAYDEHEIARIDDASLTALTREPGPVTRDAWQTSETTDARWLWVLALVLLGGEQWLRSRPTSRRHQEVTRAA